MLKLTESKIVEMTISREINWRFYMEYIRCPHCGRSDGNDDKVLSRKIIYADYTDCEISTEKQCDICGKIYEVISKYKFSHEKLCEY